VEDRGMLRRRRRKFTWLLIAALSAAVLLFWAWVLFRPPHGNRYKAIAHYAGLAPLPDDARLLDSHRYGNIFSEHVFARFDAQPDVIEEWLSRCPGVNVEEADSFPEPFYTNLRQAHPDPEECPDEDRLCCQAQVAVLASADQDPSTVGVGEHCTAPYWGLGPDWWWPELIVRKGRTWEAGRGAVIVDDERGEVWVQGFH
jgi:hypothetical protein